MKRMLLISGDRANITKLAFDPEKKELSVVSNYSAPPNVSWIEPSLSNRDVDRLIGISERSESGLLYTFEIDHTQETCKITSQQPTLGAPAHCISGLALSTKFPYKSAGHGPDEGRQCQCHPHQILEDRRGLLYVPDLGADRVWILCRDQMKLEVSGWLQCSPGTGTRHAVITPDGKTMYVIGELSHTVVAFELSASPAENIQPIEGFSPNVIPLSVHPDHQSMMDSSEICLHPNIPTVLYVTNRWERHIAEREPHLKNVSQELQPGDAIAIILLSNDGRKVQEIKFIRTNLDTIRGMRVSDDDYYVVVVGQEGSGVEIYDIGGERGDVWVLVASLNEGLESGIKHAVWL
ncbi:putative isomerase YbhE [Annulohypoxylon maeteangense]|uniref:putative isomerase YbhE n=1 Tax=Annulohypoxylon maeteangense TaxID=1927788 RepID=UPI0020077AA5|nr:putative isomerase YbhE [Annulohypoxylon maeteangense]KAI0886889.1 putative isomerase YbhE [Annulohypoxylon maeteangense]